LRFVAQFLDIPNAEQLSRSQLLHQIVARKIEYKAYPELAKGNNQ
jgi:hypothetical protein